MSDSPSFLAWNPGTGTTTLETPVHPESVGKGLAVHGGGLDTTDFAGCEVEAFAGNFFDGSFAEFEAAGGFDDDSIPERICPVGIQAIGNSRTDAPLRLGRQTFGCISLRSEL